MKKNDVLNLNIQDYGCNAEGVAKIDGQVVFVPYTIKDENVEAVLIHDKKSFFLAKVKNVLSPSKYRISPQCTHYTKCGGCQMQHISYEQTLAIKTDIVQNAMDSIGKLNKKVDFCVPSNIYYGYRNKLAMPFDVETKRLSMFANNSHRKVVVEDCPIQQSWCKKLIDITNEFVKKFQLSVYDEQTKAGLLKHLVARSYNNSLLVTIVVNGKELPHFEDYFSYLLAEFENVGLNININTLNNNVILTDNFVHLCGLKSIDIVENGISYSITNASFLQVNNYIKSKIYEQISKEVYDFDVVVDAYSGAGLLTAMLSKSSKLVYGIEIVKEATISANNLMKQNNIDNVVNICGDATQEILKISNRLQNTNSCVVIDPPRKGCDAKFLDTIKSVCVKKIVYLSCNPSTLARDLCQLKDVYDIEYILPYDMFPQTKHVETLAVLTIKSGGR